MSPARLTLFAPNLSGGGAERTLARLATRWAEQDCDVTLITLAAVSPDDFPLPANVHRLGLALTADSHGVLGAVRSNLRRISAIRAAFVAARPDVIVSFIEQANVLALLAARTLDVPVVISERTDPSRHFAGRPWEFLRRRVYHRCAALVVLTEEIADSLRPIVHGRPVVVIPNGVATPRVGEEANGNDRRPLVTAVGRLDGAKGYDRLIEAFASIAGGHPEWRLTIVGEGPQRTVLQRQIIEAGLAERVELVGRVSDPSDFFAKASLFVLPSRYEGFPNALLEAMAAGLPAVAFDGPASVRQIVRDKVDGLLVPDGDVTAFAACLEELMQDEELRRSLGAAARDVVDRFSLDAFFRRWDELISSAVKTNFSQPSCLKSE
ncbi:MAG: glycosyltransferase family 4 protein [Planctomycetaceae bacterium]|nr:glycosyltransferase family 4 protein [Planctomycetaceae bacterium]